MKPRLSTRVATAVNIGHLFPSKTRRRGSPLCATLLPGDSVMETTVIGGTFNFFSIYQNVIIARIVLSWFPSASNSPFARPLITVVDPYLSLFRRVVPPLFGTLDLSPVLALIVVQAFQSSTAALGAEMPGAPAQTPRTPTRGPWCSVLPSICTRRN